MGEVSSRIIKGGALLEETRRFVEMWDDDQAPQQNLEGFRSRNLLGKRSRVRAEDTLAILRQRFVEPGPQVVRALRTLAFSAEAFRDACYFEAARNDGLLAHVASKVLYELGTRGRTKVTVEDVQDALVRDPPAPVVAEWGQRTRTRVIHGLLSALRDFGVLEGKATKHIAPPHMAFGGFVYVLGRLRQGTASSHEIVSSPVWRWWLLEDRQVRSYFLEADREGLLRYADAGSTVRIDWRIDSLEEMARAVG
jgi:hypothetical protein